MPGWKKNILFFFALAILFPSAVNLSHIFAHEKQQVCIHTNTDLHRKNLDCELCDLYYNSLFTVELYDHQIGDPLLIDNKFFNYYHLLSDIQKLPFKLRGPPAPSFL